MHIKIKIISSFDNALIINLSKRCIEKKNIFELLYSYFEGLYLEPSCFIINLTEEEWDFIIKELNEKIEIIPKFTMGLDGTTYTIIISNGFNNFTYKLWSPHDNVNPLCIFINKVLNKIDKKEYLIN